MNVLAHQSSSRTSALIGALGLRAATARVPLTRSASVLAQSHCVPRSLDKHTYPFTSSGAPEIIDRLQYILRPIAGSSNHIGDTQRDTRQLFDELHAVVTTAARTLDTLAQMKSRIDPKILNTGERTIELEISAADLHKLLVLAAVRRNASGTAAETQQPQQPVATSALLKSSPRKHVDATNSNSYRFASTCASREPDNAQHSGVASSSQQQQQQQILTSASQQQHKAIGTNIARPTPTPRLPSYIFRHCGTVPSEPQAIDSLQFILNQKPLGATTLVSGNEGTRLFMLGTHMDSEVRTAEEAREKARLRLQELNDIVQSASGLMAALTKAQVAHDAKVVGRAAQLIPLANNDQLLDAEVLEEDGSEGFSSRRKLAIVASSVLGISSAAVCLGVLLAPEFVGFV